MIKGKRAKVKVVLRAPDGVPVTGTGAGRDQGRQDAHRHAGGRRVVVKLPKATGRKLKLTVTYPAATLAEPVVDRVTIKVRKN